MHSATHCEGEKKKLTMAFLQHTSIVAVHALACCSPVAEGYVAPLFEPMLCSSLSTLVTQQKINGFGAVPHGITMC